jgi:hypothetical protein
MVVDAAESGVAAGKPRAVKQLGATPLMDSTPAASTSSKWLTWLLITTEHLTLRAVSRGSRAAGSRAAVGGRVLAHEASGVPRRGFAPPSAIERQRRRAWPHCRRRPREGRNFGAPTNGDLERRLTGAEQRCATIAIGSTSESSQRRARGARHADLRFLVVFPPEALRATAARMSALNAFASISSPS